MIAQYLCGIEMEQVGLVNNSFLIALKRVYFDLSIHIKFARNAPDTEKEFIFLRR